MRLNVEKTKLLGKRQDLQNQLTKLENEYAEIQKKATAKKLEMIEVSLKLEKCLKNETELQKAKESLTQKVQQLENELKNLKVVLKKVNKYKIVGFKRANLRSLTKLRTTRTVNSFKA